MSSGPIQLIVCRFDEGYSRDDLMQSIRNLEQDSFRLVDALIFNMNAEGQIKPENMSSLVPQETFQFGSIITGLLDVEAAAEEVGKADENEDALLDKTNYGLSHADISIVIDQIGPGEAAAALLIEQRWAGDLRTNLSQIGGRVVGQGLLEAEPAAVIQEKGEKKNEIWAGKANSEEEQREEAVNALASAAARIAGQEEAALRAAEMLVEEGVVESEQFDEAARIVAEAVRIEEELGLAS